MERQIFHRHIALEIGPTRFEGTVGAYDSRDFILGIGRGRPLGSKGVSSDIYVVFPVEFMRQFHAAIGDAIAAHDAMDIVRVNDRPMRVGGSVR